MTITKTRLLSQINDLPEEIEMETLIERLLFIEKLEIRIQQSKKDETISEAALDNDMKEWSKLNG